MLEKQDRHKQALLTWLTMLRASGSIRKSIDFRLRDQFGVSIARFDVLAALERAGRNGLRAGELSRKLVVSDGNTTQIMGKLVTKGYVLRRRDESDARAVIYSLSDEGAALFQEMAVAHHGWIDDIFSDLPSSEIAALRDMLNRLPPQPSQD